MVYIFSGIFCCRLKLHKKLLIIWEDISDVKQIKTGCEIVSPV